MGDFLSHLFKGLGFILLGAIFGGAQGATMVATIVFAIYIYMLLAKIFAFIVSIIFPVKNKETKIKEIKNTEKPKQNTNNDALKNAYLHYALSDNHHDRGCDHHDH